MESILVNSSSQLEPVSTADSEYDEIMVAHMEEDQEVKKPHRRHSNENKPMYPPIKGTKADGETVKEVIYAEPFQGLHENQDKLLITGEATHSPIPSKPDNSVLEYAVPKPEEFKDYTDDELEQLALALSITLKQRQATVENSERHAAKPIPKRRYVNESRQRHMNSGRPQHGDNVKLDTILETNPTPDAVIDSSGPPIEVPPPIPVKKRRHRPNPEWWPQDEEGKMSEGKIISCEGNYKLLNLWLILFTGSPAQSTADNVPPSADRFRERLSGESRRRASLSNNYTCLIILCIILHFFAGRIANISTQLTKHMKL